MPDIQAIINAASHGSGLARIPTGTHPIHETLTIPSDVAVVGEGRVAQTVLTWNGNPNGEVFTFQGAHHASLEHLTIRMPQDGETTGVYIQESSGISIDDVTTEFGGFSVVITKYHSTTQRSSHVRIANCTLRSMRRHGILIRNADDVEVSNCDIGHGRGPSEGGNRGGDAIKLTNEEGLRSSRIRIIHNKLHDMPRDGIDWAIAPDPVETPGALHDVAILHNWIQGNKMLGIGLKHGHVRGIAICNNSLLDNHRNAIELRNNIQRVDISDNFISQNRRDSAQADNGDIFLASVGPIRIFGNVVMTFHDDEVAVLLTKEQGSDQNNHDVMVAANHFLNGNNAPKGKVRIIGQSAVNFRRGGNVGDGV